MKYGDLSEAEILAKKTQEMYLKIEDYERYVKSFCLIGEILIQGGTDKYNEAKLVINQGAEVAKKWQRKERYVKIAVLFINLKVLKICNDDNYTLREYFSDKEEVDMFYNEAKSLAKDIQNEAFRLELSKSYRCFIKNAKKYIKKGF